MSKCPNWLVKFRPIGEERQLFVKPPIEAHDRDEELEVARIGLIDVRVINFVEDAVRKS